MLDDKLKKLQSDWLDEATITSMQEKMESGELSAERWTFMYIDIISHRDKNINAVLELNPQAVQIAKALDIERREKGMRSLLHGILHFIERQYGD